MLNFNTSFLMNLTRYTVLIDTIALVRLTVSYRTLSHWYVSL